MRERETPFPLPLCVHRAFRRIYDINTQINPSQGKLVLSEGVPSVMYWQWCFVPLKLRPERNSDTEANM